MYNKLAVLLRNRYTKRILRRDTSYRQLYHCFISLMPICLESWMWKAFLSADLKSAERTNKSRIWDVVKHYKDIWQIHMADSLKLEKGKWTQKQFLSLATNHLSFYGNNKLELSVVSTLNVCYFFSNFNESFPLCKKIYVPTTYLPSSELACLLFTVRNLLNLS